MCPVPEREFTVTCQNRSFTARVLIDPWPDSPRHHEHTVAELVQLDTGRYRQPDQQAELTTEILRAWNRFGDEQLIGRYLTLFHDVIAWDYRTPHDGGRLFGYLTRDAWRQTRPNSHTAAAPDRGTADTVTPARQLVAAELDTYQQWAAGSVFIVEVTDARDQRTDSLSGVYTASGASDDPYIDEVAHDLASYLAATSPSTVIRAEDPAGAWAAAR